MGTFVTSNFVLSHPEESMIDRFAEAFNNDRLFETFMPMPSWLVAREHREEMYKWRACVWEAGQPTTPDPGCGCWLLRTSDRSLRFEIATKTNPPVRFFDLLTTLGYTVTGTIYDEGEYMSCQTYRNGKIEEIDLTLRNLECGDDPHEIPEFDATYA